jgi:hypothetical protein
MLDVVLQQHWYGPFGIFFTVWAVDLEWLSCAVQLVVFLNNDYSGVQPCLQQVFI